ncbi:fumarylacetoacetate hydrolase family protein [Streptomyces sp. NPDC006365]|uniref:fumarylacetoacetate hydrolase family protein n=1 Tax=Streptomyces sp. NPDC006365 TaxID=3364744 RepID=UPI0036AAEE45
MENIVAAARAPIGACRAATDMLERSADQGCYNPYGDRHPYHTTTIPILHWQNWYDPGLAPLGLRDWRHFRSLAGQRDLHFLRVGSADHSGHLLQDVGRGDERNPYLQVRLGPAKGKDSATTLGPVFVTPDELERYRAGSAYRLRMTASVNGTVVGEDLWSYMAFSYAQMIAYASRGTEVRTGDILGPCAALSSTNKASGRGGGCGVRRSRARARLRRSPRTPQS